MNAANNNWYVFYTRPNAEKSVSRALFKKHYDAFLPVLKAVHLWRNRQRKIVYVVLFPGYVFVRTEESEILNIEMIPGIVRCVKYGSRYCIVPDRDIRCIEQMLALGQQIYAEHDFTEGERVIVIKGPLTGYEGLLIKRQGQDRFGVLFDDINQCVCIDMNIKYLKRV